MVYDRGAKCAGTAAGHMALTTAVRQSNGKTTPYYNSTTKKWVISVRDANWGGCGIRSRTFTGIQKRSNGTVCADWGNLYGVNFYVPKT